MGRPYGIIVFGANGSGKSTLGRELARILDFKYMDIEEYHFVESEVPYTVERSDEDRIRLMLAGINKHGSFVLSAVTGDLGEEIEMFYKLAVQITAPKELRIERIKQRSCERYGKRVREGGDMYEQHIKFIDFAASRSLSKIGQWAKTLSCPVIHVNGRDDWRRNALKIAEYFRDEIEPFITENDQNN